MDIKKQIIELLDLTGLKPLARRAYSIVFQRFELRRRINAFKYRHVQRYEVTIDELPLVFSTEDRYSRSWFFPRYAGNKIHEEAVTRMLAAALDEARCFVDVGTNLGWYTCLAGRKMPEGQVVGFEMDAANYALLLKNLKLNGCEHVTTYQLAVSDTPGTVRYSKPTSSPSPGFRLEHGSGSPGSGRLVAVEAVRLDDFLPERQLRPDVVKIDVEGAEMLVLRGMRKILEREAPRLFLEVHPETIGDFDSTVADVLSLLVDNGYSISRICGMLPDRSGPRLVNVGPETQISRNSNLYAEKRDGQ